MTASGDTSATQENTAHAGEGSARAVVMAIQDAFRTADYERMAALYDDDVDWLFYGPVSIFPAVGHRRGKIAVFEAFAALNVLYRFERYVTDHLIAEGDWAAGISDVTLRQRTGGRIIQCRIASFHRVRDGRLVRYRGFTDSFDAVEQVLGKIITP